jgi:hypothetical protein
MTLVRDSVDDVEALDRFADAARVAGASLDAAATGPSTAPRAAVV